MAYLYRPTYTKPIPAGAELFTARASDSPAGPTAGARRKTAKVTTTDAGANRLVFTSPFWRCRYRDGTGVVRDVPTGCRDEVAAQGVANELQRRAELVKAGTIKPAEDAAADHQGTPLAKHLDAYGKWQAAFGNRGGPVTPCTAPTPTRPCGGWRRIASGSGWPT